MVATKPLLDPESTDTGYRPNIPSGTGMPSVYKDFFDLPTYGTSFPRTVEGHLQYVILSLMQDVQLLSAEVKTLRNELTNRPLVSSILLNDLSTDQLGLLIPISAIIEESPDECLARWPEVNAFGIGATLNEAIYNLKENISDIYLDLKSREPSSLGVIAEDMLRILMIYIRNQR